jgi:hypothetical protein
VLGVVLHQLAPQHQGVLAGGVRDLVDEARDVDRVLLQIHAAPEARRHVRVADRVVDEQVRDAVAKHGLAAAVVEALEHQEVLAVAHVLREHRGQDALAPDAHVQRGHVALRVGWH